MRQIPECSIQGRQGEVESDKAQYSTPFFLTSCFLLEGVETQNLGKAQALGALLAVFNNFSRKIRQTLGPIQHDI